MSIKAAFGRMENGLWKVLKEDLRFSNSPSPTQTSFYAPNFAMNQPNPWLVGSQVLELTTKELADGLPEEPLALEVVESCAAEDFFNRHQRILQSIEAGEFQKVVPAVFDEGRIRAGSFAGMWRRLLNTSGELWPYGFHLENEGILGVTPEILFQKQGLELRTQAVAGTAIHGESLLSNDKECREHQLVIEDLTQELAPLGEVWIGQTGEKLAGHLRHLVTPLKVRLKSSLSFEEIAQRLHPTAALGGFPRRAGKEWLGRQREFLSRERFGAPFGWREPNGDGLCLVAIRNIQWHGENVLIGAGCGVVKGSRPESEWAELAQKRRAIFRALELT